MAVFRVNKNINYTVMSNHHLRDTTLSLKAIGLLSKILSLPDGWDYSISGLVAICKEHRTAVESALKELKEHGYMTVEKLMPNQTDSGRIEYVYNIFETPIEAEKQGVENLCLESQVVENHEQLNKEKSNKEKLKKENIYGDVPEEIKDVFMEWVEMRKSIKKPVRTKGTVTRALNELKRLSQDEQTQRKIIKKAIDRNWLGFYPLDDKKPVRNGFTAPEPPKYKQFEPDPVVETTQMPEEIRRKYKQYEKELSL